MYLHVNCASAIGTRLNILFRFVFFTLTGLPQWWLPGTWRRQEAIKPGPPGPTALHLTSSPKDAV